MRKGEPRRDAGVLFLLAYLAFAPAVLAERDRLYSELDPSAGGGIRGEIADVAAPILEVLAVPPDEPRLVYRGTVSGANRRAFAFQGLPMRKYDLVVIYDNAFYEGLTLSREDNTLTAGDRKKIEETIRKAEPFFKRKIIHRVEGTTGRGNECRCVCTYLRDMVSENSPPGEGAYRRSFRLLMLKDVGPGWQIVRSRDLYPTWTTQDKVVARHRYAAGLSGIRVTDGVKDVGRLNVRGQ